MKTLSISKKIGKSRNALYKGSGLSWVTILYYCLVLLMVGVCVGASLDKSSVEDGDMFTMLIAQVIWMSLFVYFYRAVLPTQFSAKQRAAFKGNGSISEVFVQFPVTKKDCIKVSLMEWMKCSVPSIVLGIYLCIATMIFDYLSVQKGAIGFMVLMIIISTCFVEFISIISVNSKKDIKTKLYVILFILYFALIISSTFLAMMSFMEKFYDLFKAFSGPIGICLLILVIPVMYLLTKILILDKTGREAWHYENNV